MKYSIIINPFSHKSDALLHGINFIQAVNQQKYDEINLFLYGYAVKSAFFNDCWDKLALKVRVVACSTIAHEYLEKGLKPHKNVTIAGLGLYMEAIIGADKRIEFV